MRSLHGLFSACIAAAVAAGCGPSGPDPGYCGDGRCDYVAGESHYACPADCPPGPDGGGTPGGHCGDGACGSGENGTNCPEDCATSNGYCGDHLPISPSRVYLPVPPLAQQCQEWCWAATITMAAQYYGVAVDECTLASIKAGFQYPACCDYAACSYSACDQPAPQPQMEYMLGTVLRIHGYALDASISESQIKTEISNGRPIIVGYLNSFAGHVVMVTGYQPSLVSGGGAQFHVVDPYYGIFDVTYDQLAYGYMGGGYPWRWGYTIMHLSPRTDGCNLGFDPGCRCE